MRVALVVFASLGLFACDSGSPGEPSPAIDPDASAPAPTWYGDVAPILAAHCTACHEGGRVGPFSLKSYEDAAPRHLALAQATRTGRMPPWLPDESCRSLRASRRLGPNEIDVLQRWSGAGAPRGDVDKQAPIVARSKAALAWIDREIDPGVDYVPRPPKGSVDDRRCFVVDPAITEDTFLVGYDLAPTYRPQVLRAVLYETDLADARARDDADPSPGFACDGAAAPLRIVGRWAWAFGPVAFPAGAGLRLRAGRGLILELFYHLHEATLGAPDRTKVSLQLAREPVAREAEFVLVQPPFSIVPARTSDFSVSSSVTLPDGGTVWAVEPRMNLLGAKFRAELEQASCLLDVPRWDYHWEELQFFQEGAPVPAGGRIAATCTWQNPTDQPRSNGPGIYDEACEAAVVVTRP